MLPGIRRKTMVHGPNSLLAEFHLARGAVIPLHQHPQEQTGYLVSGHAVFTIAGVEHEVRPGASWSIPGGVELPDPGLRRLAVSLYPPMLRRSS